jgi:hypothetical protein
MKSHVSEDTLKQFPDGSGSDKVQEMDVFFSK